MDKLIAESVALLRKMISVKSLSFEEGDVADLVSGFLLECGICPRRYGNNVVAVNSHYDPSLPTLVLDAHLDTVPAAASYSRDPFDAGTEPDIVFGLGSNDDGGSVVSMIAAFRWYYQAKMPVNLVLALTCEEERSGPSGARFLYGEDGPMETVSAGWVIVGEPTGMRAATSERGLLVLDGTARGVSGHAARNEGVNALYIALDDIDALRNHIFERVSPMMGKINLNVTQISSGSAHNVIPDICTFVVDIRPTDRYTNEEILEELRGLCRSELTARNLANRSSAVGEESALVDCVRRLGIETFSSPTTSDWMRIGNREGIKIGPGDSSRSHHADEYILVSEIENAVKTYINLIEKFYDKYIVE